MTATPAASILAGGEWAEMKRAQPMNEWWANYRGASAPHRLDGSALRRRLRHRVDVTALTSAAGLMAARSTGDALPQASSEPGDARAGAKWFAERHAGPAA